jgi:hypothetical protein
MGNKSIKEVIDRTKEHAKKLAESVRRIKFEY